MKCGSILRDHLFLCFYLKQNKSSDWYIRSDRNKYIDKTTIICNFDKAYKINIDYKVVKAII